MLPLLNFKTLLEECKEQFVENIDELILGAQLVGQRENYLLVDDNGNYFFQVAGTLPQLIEAAAHLQARLKRLQQQKENI